ncbi:MAG TPA: MerR family transcriptional regulator [Candidatus Kapabacteria bacterium]|jgi:DNA-binding transcriptional MerR regulator|nr:MerR family transcriptional regulator [Candidatus Kapabacteria bacterium]
MKKLYYSISEISKILDEEQYILRYWEKEFDFLKPRKNRAGNRIYSEKDLQTLKLIKSFIRDEKLSVKEANNRLKNLLKSNEIEHYLPNTMAEKPVTNSGSKQKEKINKELKQELLIVLRDMLNYLKSH